MQSNRLEYLIESDSAGYRQNPTLFDTRILSDLNGQGCTG